MALCGRSTSELRLPLVGLNNENKVRLANLINELNLLDND